MDLTINVGAGTRDQAMQGLAQIAALQEKILTMQGNFEGPFVTPDNVANTAQKITETLGYKTPALFFQPAEKVMQALQAQAGQPPKPDPKVQAEQARAQADQQATQAKLAADMQRMQAQAAIQAQKDNAHKEHLQLQLQIELARGAHQRQQGVLDRAATVSDHAHDLVMAGLGEAAAHNDREHQIKVTVAKTPPNGGAPT